MNRAVQVARFAHRHQTVLRQQGRNMSDGYVGYRELNYEPGRKWKKVTAEGLVGLMWWWIGWNLMTDYGHVVGEFIWPTRANWTDEELGIPKE